MSLLEQIRLAIRWRLWRLVKPLYLRRWDIFCWAAKRYRNIFLRRVVFIGITGSSGKTTTKEITAAVLSSRYKGHKNLNTRNISVDIAKTIFEVMPWDRFCVQELSVGSMVLKSVESTFEESIEMIKPKIAVVTNVSMDHISEFGTKENIAAEKGKLISALPPHGTAILNADDEHVMAMRQRFAGRIITFGTAPEATVRAENISSIWPERLSFTVHYAGKSSVVQTQLCGKHWAHSVLAAIATGIAMDVPFTMAVKSVHMFPPWRLRLCPVTHPDGITFVRDDWKAPLSTVGPALDFLKQARANRKIAIVGTLSDYRGDASAQYIKVARQALEAADFVFFVGQWASRCLRAKRHPQDDALRAFSNVEDISKFLLSFLEPGDLVLLKGRTTIDRLGKIIDTCSNASFKSRGMSSTTGLPEEDNHKNQITAPRELFAKPLKASLLHPDQVVVGLGNTGEHFRNTRHNIGHRVVDVIADTYKAEWRQEGKALLARIDRQGKSVYLVKASTKVNDTGQVLLQLADQMRLEPSECILVHDELDLALGVMRLRTKGSAGGHNGIRSIIDAFQSEDFRRMKLGIGRPERKDQIMEYVLQEFPSADCLTVEEVCINAAKRVLDYIDHSDVTASQITRIGAQHPAESQ
jgi:aminoacyl-tRNA hydrolase